MGVRVRLRFDSSPLHYSRQCWFLFDPNSCSVVSDVAFLIAKHFNLHREGLQLYMDGYLLPAKESAHIIRDNDALQVRGAECSESSGSSSDEEGPPAKRRKGEKEAKQTKMNKRRSKVRESAVKKSPPVRRKRKGGAEEEVGPGRGVEEEVGPGRGAEGEVESERSASQKTQVVAHPKKKAHITSAANQKSFQRDNTSTQTGGALHAVTSTLPSGAQRTVFRSSSSSESEGSSPDEVQTQQQPVIPLSSVQSPRETQWDKRPEKSVSEGTRNTPRSMSGRKRKFPRVVGGPNDIHTTKSTVYKRQEQNGGFLAENRHRQSETSGENGAATKDLAKHPTSEGIVVGGSLERESAADVHTVDLSGPPRVGDVIAFKVLELTSSYTPELSDYKEASVLSFDGVSKTVRLKYSETTMGRERERVARGNEGKFSLPDDPGTDMEPATEVEIPLDSMVETKLVLPN